MAFEPHLSNLVTMSVDHTPAELRSEEHTSELQSQSNLVCRLLLETKRWHEPTLLSVAATPAQALTHGTALFGGYRPRVFVICIRCPPLRGRLSPRRRWLLMSCACA